MASQEQYVVVIASGASTSSNLSFRRIYRQYGVTVGTMSTGVVIGVHMSPDGGTTFKQLMQPTNPLTATVTNLTFQIGTNVGAGGGFVNVPGGYNTFRLVLTGVVSGGVSFNVIGYD